MFAIIDSMNRFFVLIFIAFASIPACVSLPTGNEAKVTKKEKKTNSNNQQLSISSTSWVHKKSDGSTYYQAPYNPEEWTKMMSAMGSRKALSGTQSMRFHSAKSESGWDYNSSRKIYSTSAAASYAIGERQAAEKRDYENSLSSQLENLGIE